MAWAQVLMVSRAIECLKKRLHGLDVGPASDEQRRLDVPDLSDVARAATQQQRRWNAMKWTIGQENVIRELRFLGAQGVRDAIEKEFGVSHTKHAVQVRASLLGISLQKRYRCPECGDIVESVNRLSGLCLRCSVYCRIQEEISFSEAIEREHMERLDGPSLEEAKHKYHALRQQNRRRCEKYGLDVKAMRKRHKAERG